MARKMIRGQAQSMEKFSDNGTWLKRNRRRTSLVKCYSSRCDTSPTTSAECGRGSSLSSKKG